MSNFHQKSTGKKIAFFSILIIVIALIYAFSSSFRRGLNDILISDPYLRAIYNIRENDRSAKVDITNLSLEFYPLNTSRHTMLNSLIARGFKVESDANTARSQDTDFAYYNLSQSIVHDEVKLIINFKDDQLERLIGEINLVGP